MDTLIYWEPQHIERLGKVSGYEDIGKISLEVARKIPQPLEIVSGPISTGGLGSLEKNLDVFQRTILKLSQQGKIMFNQIPIEEPIQRLKTNSHYDFGVLTKIYLPLLESGLIKTLNLIYGWKTSTGALWEHDNARRLRVNVAYLPKNFHKT